jgi:hypothetical protein
MAGQRGSTSDPDLDDTRQSPLALLDLEAQPHRRTCRDRWSAQLCRHKLMWANSWGVRISWSAACWRFVVI